MTAYTKSVTHAGLQGLELATEIELKAKQVMHIDLRGRSFDLHSVRGKLWVTLQNNPSDFILKTGDYLTVKGKGRVVVQAMADSSFRYR